MRYYSIFAFIILLLISDVMRNSLSSAIRIINFYRSIIGKPHPGTPPEREIKEGPWRDAGFTGPLLGGVQGWVAVLISNVLPATE